MAKLYFDSRDELTCIDSDLVAVVQANGNYSRVVYITKREIVLTQGISKMEEILKMYNSSTNRTASYTSGQTNVTLTSGSTWYAQSSKAGSTYTANWNANGIPKQILRNYKNATIKSIQLKEQEKL